MKQLYCGIAAMLFRYYGDGWRQRTTIALRDVTCSRNFAPVTSPYIHRNQRRYHVKKVYINVWGINDVNENKKIRTHEGSCGEDIWKHKSEWYDVIKLGRRKGVLSAWKDKESGSEPSTTVDLSATVTVIEGTANIWLYPAVAILRRIQTTFAIHQLKLLTWCISNWCILRYLSAFVTNRFQVRHPRCVEYTLKYNIKYI
jgi:hypothetical protein